MDVKNNNNFLFKIFFFGLLIYLYASSCFAANSPFSVTFISSSTDDSGNPILFDMVPSSTQQLKFNITSNIGKTLIIKCSVSSSSLDSVGTLGGCANINGAGTPYPLVFTITAGTTSGAVSHTLTIQDKSGRNVTKIPLNYTITSNAARTITFENYCPFDVWFGIATGTLAPLSGSTCTSSTNCPAGTECDSASGNCYWIPPSPNTTATNAEDTYKLTAYSSGTPASNSITIPDYSTINGNTKLWSGGFNARKDCSFSSNAISCATADCGDDGTGKGGCKIGQGFSAPSTQAEVTFLVKTADSYDVTIINGFHVPIAYGPTSIAVGANSPYDCGTPGITTSTSFTNQLYSTATPSPTGSLSGCGWALSPPNDNLRYRYVDNSTSTSCTSDSVCGSNKCGMTRQNVLANSDALTCGKLLGFWTQDEICVANQNFSSANIVDCTSTSEISACTANGTTCPVTVTGGTYSFYNLLACTSAPPDVEDNAVTFASCFATGDYSSSNCCGCSNWQDTSGFTGTIPSDSTLVPQCNTGNDKTPNANWTTSILPNLTWLKNACPSAYTYPYDDKTSGFSCPYSYEGGQSSVNYTVTFCPGQKTGGVL